MISSIYTLFLFVNFHPTPNSGAETISYLKKREQYCKKNKICGILSKKKISWNFYRKENLEKLFLRHCQSQNCICSF